MQRPVTSTRVSVCVAVVALIALITSSCSNRPISMPPAEQLPAPTFVALPADLADSLQLDAIDDRDTAGLPAGVDAAAPELLGPALAAYRALPDAQTELTRLSIYEDSVYFTYYERGVAGRSVTAYYRLPWEGSDDEQPTLDITEPTFGDQPTFSIEGLDPDVPARLVAALTERFPAVAVDSIDVDATPVFGYGAVWKLRLSDARGRLAEITADFDGAIVAVSMG